MDQTIKEIYESSVTAQEREIDFVKNRLEFINWLFGVASALLFSSVVAARAITPTTCPVIAPENYIAIAVGLFSFIAIIFSFIGKWQGYSSIGARVNLLTLLDVQKYAFLKEQPPADDNDKKIVKFSMFEYLPEKLYFKYLHNSKYCERKYNEVLWLILVSFSVFVSIASMLVLLLELTI